MSSCWTLNRLAEAEAVGRVLMVAMNDVQFVDFEETSAIGTRDLAGCSVVVVASAYGAILAHIPPRPIPDSRNVHAGDENVQRLMEEVAALYNENRNNFPETETYAVFAAYNGTLALPDQTKIIEDKISHIGLRPSHNTIYVTPRDPLNHAHGTVLVDSLIRIGHKPAVFTEDRLVSDEQQALRSWSWNATCRTHSQAPK